jgi:alkanesulfonate monooxygenase SsuD/methylene tetrahydromethanopterin reductase-like flavin-dependent oxidoreductase (luciferase family)
VTVDESGQPLSGDVVIRNTVEEAVLADAVGIDSFNIGEHYRADLMDSAGHVMLAAIAGRTERIRLGTAVTVLSTQDPVRVYTEFATLDAVSNGRAQLIVGRGSLTDSLCSDSTSPTTRRCSRRTSTYSDGCSGTNP